VEVDEALCNGCVLCMKACPTKAIRVRDGKATVEGVCIDCVECVRVCPRDAMKAVTMEGTGLRNRKNYVVSPSTVLYSQFGGDYLPNDILLGLRKMGFGYVHDQSYTSEIFAFAVELYIRESRKRPGAPFPLISPVCPVVVRLIAYRFPSLLKHIPPLATPREIVAREAKKRLSAKTGCMPEDVNVLHITPCPAMMNRITEIAREQGSGDKAIGISHIYESLGQTIQEIDEDRILHHSGGVGVGWGVSGGEIAAMNANCLAVSGLHETIRYLEMIEMGLLRDIDYTEFRICTEGCIGGPFTVEDRYQTKRLIQRLVRMFGVEKRIKYKYIIKLYKEGWFASERKRVSLQEDRGQADGDHISERIERQNRVEDTLKMLPRKECGVCGSPDCRTFAEDVVDGKARLQSCLYLEGRTGKRAPTEED
jgi:formate hydrogenlyase subunit 6/NADH:ubiquinone oxidoreductase subunit I